MAEDINTLFEQSMRSRQNQQRLESIAAKGRAKRERQQAISQTAMNLMQREGQGSGLVPKGFHQKYVVARLKRAGKVPRKSRERFARRMREIAGRQPLPTARSASVFEEEQPRGLFSLSTYRT